MTTRPRWQAVINLGASALLVWQVAPLLAWGGEHPFDSPGRRLGLLLGLGLALLATRQAVRWRAQRQNAGLLAGLLGSQQAGDEALHARFAQALAVLRAGILGSTAGAHQASDARRWWTRRRLVYQLPWYLFIGAPGAGKTTALLHSGLRFPLASLMGTTPLGGIGGTRHCDWWFTDRAVFIDTAGRYTTQDSDARADAGEWHTFLRLLRRHRPAQPINGVIVTVSVADLLGPAAALAQQARAVDARLQELREQLGQRLPVYLLVTKADLLAGFNEFFARLDASERDQVWGVGHGWAGSQARLTQPDTVNFDAGLVGTQVQALSRRLAALTPERLQAEPLLQRRAAIYRFAAQVDSLAEPLNGFAAVALQRTGTLPQQDMRGVFLTSGTQEGNPIDRVLGSLARGFGLPVQPLARPDGAGKAYFLGRLLRERVIGEAPLAGNNLARQRWRRRMQLAAAGLLGSTLLLACAFWAWSARHNAAYVEAVGQRVAAVSAQVQGRPVQRIDRLVPLYTTLRDLARSGGLDPQAPPPPGLGWGLFQGPRLAQTAAQTYQHVLDRSLAPLIGRRLAAVLGDSGTADADAFEALRVHAMLQQPEHLRREDVRAWAARSFALDASGAGIAPGEQGDWLTHLDALLERNAVLDAAQVDTATVQAARERLRQVPIAERAYQRLLQTAAAAPSGTSPLLDLARVAGAQAARVLGPRLPGQTLPDLPLVYSAQGWREQVRPRLAAAAAQAVAEETWVLGSPARAPADAVAAEMLRLYADDHSRHWDAWLGQLGLAPQAVAPRPGGEAPEAVLRRLLAGLPAELQPGTPPAGSAAGPFDTALNEQLAAHHAPLLSQLTSAAEDAPRALLDRLAHAGAPGTPAADELLARLRRAAAQAPAPLATLWTQWAQQLAAQRSRLSDEPWRVALDDLAGACRAMTSGHFPFNARGRADMALADFGRLFGPQGLFDEFFRQHWRTAVDTARRPWRWAAGGAPPPAIALQAVEQAAQIRQAFFPDTAPTPALRLSLVPVDMDPALFWFSLDVDGQALRYENGPHRAKAIAWPLAGAAGKVLLRIPRPDSPDTASELHEGPWALWRVLMREPWQRAAAPNGTPASATVHVAVEGHTLTLALSAEPPGDPWLVYQLSRFNCPAAAASP